MTNGLNDIPREKLAELISKHGDTLVQDRDRCEGLLRDHCGAYRREISALTAALHERVPQELKSSWQTAMTPEAMRARLVERLEDHRGLASPVAGWAVDSWAHALQVPLGRISDRVDSEVISPPSEPPVAPAVSSGSVWTGPLPSLHGASQANQQISFTSADPSAAAKQVSISSPASIIAKPATRSFLGLGIAAACVFAFYTIRNSNQPHEGGGPIPCATKAADGSCSQPSNGGGGTTGGDPSTGDSGTKGTTGNTAPLPPPPPSDVVAAGTPLRIRINEGLSSASAQPGQYVGATLLDPITVNGKQVLPAGSQAVLVVKTVESAGKLSGVPELGLTLYAIYLQNRPLLAATNEHIQKGPSRTVSTVKKTGIASAAGCVVGGVVGKIFKHGGKGCGIGAGAGAAGGVAYSAESQARPATIAAETVLRFQLSRPLALHIRTASSAPENTKS